MGTLLSWWMVNVLQAAQKRGACRPRGDGAAHLLRSAVQNFPSAAVSLSEKLKTCVRVGKPSEHRHSLRSVVYWD